MARTNPLTSMKDLTLGALKAPLGVADKAVGGLGRVAGAVTTLIPGSKASSPSPSPSPSPSASPSGTGEAKPSDTPTKVHGDALAGSKPVSTKKSPSEKPAAKKSPAAKPVAKKAPAQKPAAKKAPAKKPAAKKAPAQKGVAAKASPDVTVPVNVVEELGLDPAPVTVQQPASDLEPGPVTTIDAKTPADVTASPVDVAAVLNDEAQSASTTDS